MANDGMIDLGRKPESLKPSEAQVSKEPKVYYPILHVNDVDGLNELPDGEFTFTGKGKVVSCTESTRNGKTTCSYDIEVHGIKPDAPKKEKKAKEADERLDDSFDQIAKKKADAYDEEDDSEG